MLLPRAAGKMVRGPKKHLKRLVRGGGGRASGGGPRGGGGQARAALHCVLTCLRCLLALLQNAPKHWMLDKLGGIFVS